MSVCVLDVSMLMFIGDWLDPILQSPPQCDGPENIKYPSYRSNYRNIKV